MVGAIVSGVLGLGGSIYGGIKAGEARKRMSQYLSGQEVDNRALYDKDYHQNYLDRTDTQALIKSLRNTLKGQSESAAQMATVTGATPESVAVAKEQSGKTIDNVYSNISAQGQRFKDNVQNRYIQRKNALSNLRYGEMESTATSYENLMQNGIKGLSNLSSAFGSG